MRDKLLNSTGAAFSAWILPFVYLAFSGPPLESSGRIDNSAYLAGGAILMLTPVILTALFAYFFSVVSILSFLGLDSLSARLLIASIPSAAFGLLVYRDAASDVSGLYALRIGAEASGLPFGILATGELARWFGVRRITHRCRRTSP